MKGGAEIWLYYPHECVAEIGRLESYPHHFQRRGADGRCIFETSSMRGDIQQEMDTVIAFVKAYLQQ